MKYLGIDFGSKRIGIALSDIEGRMAFPHSVIQNRSDIVARTKMIEGDIWEKKNEILETTKKLLGGEPFWIQDFVGVGGCRTHGASRRPYFGGGDGMRSQVTKYFFCAPR